LRFYTLIRRGGISARDGEGFQPSLRFWWFLNALPPNALPRRHIQLDMIPVNIVDLAHWLHRRLQEGYQLIHYIRHPATLRALVNALHVPLPLEPNSGLYQYEPGDVIVVVTLRSPVRGQEQQQVNIDDLEFWIVTVL
jgi:hypothetical protein